MAYIRVRPHPQVPAIHLHHWPLLHMLQDLVNRFVSIALREEGRGREREREREGEREGEGGRERGREGEGGRERGRERA